MESGGSAYNDSELLQYINELHEQLKSKDDHIGWNFLSIRLTQLVKLVNKSPLPPRGPPFISVLKVDISKMDFFFRFPTFY